MKMQLQRTESASTLVCALCIILVLSFIGANVLVSSASRYNVASKQVKAWKEALYAAEAGGDIGFAEVRKVLTAPGTEFSDWTDPQGVQHHWTSPAASPAPTPGAINPGSGTSYSTGDWNPGGPSPTPIPTAITFGPGNSLSTKIKVDQFSTDSSNGSKYYRIRAVGTATLFGLPRVGMGDAIVAGGTHFATNSPLRGTGDSLIRKIDFNYDHFKATYGDGDGTGLGSQSVSNPQISRRVELIAVAQMAFTGAMKVTGSFAGPGSAGSIDSYDSKNGAYDPSVVTNPSSPYYADSRNGDVSVATPNFTEGGPIYGNVTTNGGNVKASNTQISGTIDNNVPFTVPQLAKPAYPTGYYTGSGTTINPPSGTSAASPAFYVYSSLTSGVTINDNSSDTGSYKETYVTIVVNGDVGQNITINPHVNAKIYFTGNLTLKGKDIANNNVDGPPPPLSGWAMSPNPPSPSRAGHLQFYGISPTDGSYQTININPPGNIYATFYAPNGDITETGNPDIFGAIVAHNFSGNGNTGFHYDKEIADLGGIALDYQIASFMEDIR